MERSYQTTYAGTDNNLKRKGSRKEEEARRYAEAVELYSNSGKSLSEVASQCGVRTSGLASHISRYHSELPLNHYAYYKGNDRLERITPKLQTGQFRATHQKYRRAIEACSEMTYIEFNVAQVAKFFRLSGDALMQQLRMYYPELLEQREKMRSRLGIASKGPRKETTDIYSEALEMYRTTDLNLARVAERCRVSRCGFSRFMRCYHSDLVKEKEERHKAERHLRSGKGTNVTSEE